MMSIVIFKFGLLVGIKVFELGMLIVGFFCLCMLVEFGVEVIKIEVFGDGDFLCYWCVFKDGILLWWLVQVCNKKSIILNMKDECVQEIVCQLVLDVDVIIENYCFGVFEKWKFGYEDLK